MAKSIADIFADFREDALRQQQLFEKACDANVQLMELRQQIREAGARQLEAIVHGQSHSDAELERLEAAAAEIVRTQIHEPQFNCNRCKDTGKNADGLCICLLEKIYTNYYGAIHIDTLQKGFDDFQLSLFDDTETILAGKTQRQWMECYLELAKSYVADFPNNTKRNILMIGKAGLGKSFLLNCIAKAAKARDIDTLFIRSSELFGVFHAHRMGSGVDLSHLHRAKLLLVDDLGTEPITQNVSIEYLYNMVDKRLENGLHTVFATNVSNLQQRYDDRIASRLKSKDSSMCFYFEGRDLRLP